MNKTHTQTRQAGTEQLRHGDVVVSGRKSFFDCVEDFHLAYAHLATLLSRPSVQGVEPDDDGHYSEPLVLKALSEECPALSYVQHDHLVELYMKDPSSRLSYDSAAGARYGCTTSGLAIPPDVLYYATTARIASRVVERGLQSASKPYLPLSTTIEEACRKCLWFVRSNNDSLVVVTVDAGAAYEDRVQFSFSAKSCEFLVESLSPRYIIGTKNMGKVLDDMSLQGGD